MLNSVKFSCGCSASAARLLGIGIVLLRELEANGVLCDGWMDADCGVELRLGDATLDGNRDTLSDLSGVWS